MSNQATQGTEVKVGQRYVDADPRIRDVGANIPVTRIIEVIAVNDTYATVQNVDHSDPKMVGRKVAIRLDRFRPKYFKLWINHGPNSARVADNFQRHSRATAGQVHKHGAKSCGHCGANIAAPVAPKITKTHAIIVRDVSGSMRGHSAGAKDFLQKQLDALKNAKGQENTVTIFDFGYDQWPYVRETLFNQSADLVQNPVWNCYGDTPLYDGVIEAGQRALADKDPDKSFLMLVITDGQENKSKRTDRQLRDFIAAQQATDRWTFAFLVPPGYKQAFVNLAGVPAGNVQEWSDIQQAEKEATVSTQNYLQQRAKGVRSSKSYFVTDLSNITVHDLSQLKDVTNLIDVWTVDQETDVLTFVDQKSRGNFYRGRRYFEIMKKEDKFQDWKGLLIQDKTTKRIYSDGITTVRQLCGFPHSTGAGGSVSIDPGNHANFTLYGESTSTNRKLPRGTKVAFWSQR